MKSQIMRKLFIGNLLIFAFLLILQFGFQLVLFEPFLTKTQSNRLIKSVDNLQSLIAKEDEEEVRQQIKQAANKGIVIVVVDQTLNQVYGQHLDSYQHCFTVENDHKEQYNIVEDYLESISMQTIQEGDVVSIEGYLVDERNAFVIPSKVCRARDGLVLGTDTFLIIKPTDTPEIEEDNDQVAMESGVAVSSQTGVAVSVDTSDSNGTEATIQDESNLPKGFILQSPYNTPGSNDQLELGGTTLAGASQSTALRDERMLIMSGGDRSASSFPISIHGTVVDIVDVSNNDLLVQQGLITEEIKRLSASADTTAFDNSYTVADQLTTGKYLLRVSHSAKCGMTVIGAISLYSIQDMNHMMNTFHAWLFLLELGLIVCALYFFSRMISKPLIEMNGVALKIAHQDFSSRVNVTTDDEVGMVGASINEISINLEQKICQINRLNDHLRRDYERQLDLQERHKQLSATFSHEMKTPLTILRGYIDGMQSGVNPKKQKEYYEIALRELDSASSLVTQMLEIARIESPYFAPKKAVVDLWMIFYKVYDELKLSMDQKDMLVVFSAEDEANTLADAELLERVISNVLTNALKYSPRGSRIIVSIRTDLERHMFCVENENAYISPEEIEKIWQPFYRAEKLKTSEVRGKGLGLMIVSEILVSHEFEYGIRNTDHGVEFRFSCPEIHNASEQENVT